MKKSGLLFIMMCGLAWTGWAAVVGPYPQDAQTLHLYHFDGTTKDTVETDSIDLTLGGGATVDEESLSGFATALNTQGSGYYAGGSSNPVLISNFVGADGAFTFEAIVKPGIGLNPPHHMQIVCGDDGDAPTARGWHFRINVDGNLQFTKITGVEDFTVAVPTSGTHGYQIGAWYHVAVTYNGVNNTADNLKLYWTKLDSGVSQAQELASFQMISDLDETQNTNFCVGNELRGSPDEAFEGLIDSVRISDTARAADEMMLSTSVGWARNPDPAHGAIDIDPAIVPSLIWDQAQVPNVSKHYLYVVEGEPNFVGASYIEVTDVTDPIEQNYALATDSIYYWRVDESINNSAPQALETITGPIWTFQTIVSIPEITGDPQDTGGFAGETVFLETSFDSSSVPTVEWYKEGTPDTLVASHIGSGSTTIGDYTVFVSDLGEGAYVTELQIADLDTAKEGYYYCAVFNPQDEGVTSLSAGVYINRLLAKYMFDGDTTDAVGVLDGTLTTIDDPNNVPTPVYVAGVPDLGNQGIQLDGNQYVDLSVDGYPNASLGGGLNAGTITLWVNLPAGSNNPVADPMGVVNPDGTFFRTFYMPSDSYLNPTGRDRIQLRIANTSGNAIESTFDTADDVDLRDGQWHLLGFVWDCTQGLIELYADGVQLGSFTGSPFSGFGPWTLPMVIGGTRAATSVSNPLTGAVDDVRIYNYPLSETAMADTYVEGYSDAYFCLNTEEDFVAAFDFDNNCRIDLGDFALLATNWLSCGRYPITECD